MSDVVGPTKPRGRGDEFGEGPAGSTPEERDRPDVTHRPPARLLSIRDRRIEVAWLGALFIGWTALAHYFPPNGDDWAWGSQIGVSRLDNHFAGYNGRYVANLVVLLLTRAPILAAVVVGVTMTATIYLVLSITGNRKPWAYGVTTVLLLAMPHALWSQAISWLSGFTNYTMGTLWVLIFVRSVQLDWRRGAQGVARPWRAIGIACFAFAASLFMENVTIFFVIASIAVIVAQRKQFSRVSLSAWCWAAGFLVGAVVMFSNSAYRRASTGQGYQQMSGTGGMLTTFTGPISRYTVIEPLALDLAIVVLVVILAGSLLRQGRRVPALIAIASALVFLAITVPLKLAEINGHVSSRWEKLGGVAMILLLVCLCTVGLKLLTSASQRILLLSLVFSSVLLLGPLLVVTPIGPRCFYVVYVLMLAIVSIVAREVVELCGKVVASSAGIVSALVAAGLTACIFLVYVPMSSASHGRVTSIRHQVAAGATVVVVKRLPNGHYTHHPDPDTKLWSTRYKLFYGLPKDLKIKIAPGS